MFKHFLITRFNLRASDWTETRKNEKVLTPEWLSHRFRLFEKYCFPSVVNQSSQNFTWLVYFDEETPVEYKEKILRMSRKHPIFQPVFINGMSSFYSSILSETSNLLSDKETHLITSRIDNDDSLHKDYIQEVQSYFQGQDYWALDHIDGYHLQVEPVMKLGKVRQRFNPFVSLIEARTSYITVWGRTHGDWKRESRIQTIMHKRLWSTTIHGKNKANDYWGFGKVDSELFSKNFNLPDLEENLRFNMLESGLNYFNCHRKSTYKAIKKALGGYR